MQSFLKKYEKYASWFFFGIMILCLIPMAVMGFYNHPLGDDFDYGRRAMICFREDGTLPEILSVALEGTIEQYHIWQGTYSAMFLMHLPPHVFGDFFYKLYPVVLFICFTGSIFYLMHSLLCTLLNASRRAWVLISSLLVTVCIIQVPLCGETFYWYNGSMYYTGFYACTCFFWGLLIKDILKSEILKTVILCLMAFFIAGGNYTSLLPTMIIIVLMMLYYGYKGVYKKEKVKHTLIILGVVFAVMLVGFMISVLAPGNALRQATSWKISPVKAILKSILQNTRYCLYWNGIWSLLYFLFLTPIYICVIEKCKFTFKYPLPVSCLMFGIYCSTSCPTFYAQNNGGAARVFCLVYYIMMLTLSFIYFYLLGAVYNRCLKKDNIQKNKLKTYLVLAVQGMIVVVYVLLSVARKDAMFVKANPVTAMQSLLNGDAAYYEEQYQERVAVLENESVKEVVFPAYDVPENLVNFLYLGDISDDETTPANQYLAEVYNKKSVKIQYE